MGHRLIFPTKVTKFKTFCVNLFRDILRYPKMHRIFIKSCPLHKQSYLNGERLIASSMKSFSCSEFSLKQMLNADGLNQNLHHFGSWCCFIQNIVLDNVCPIQKSKKL